MDQDRKIIRPEDLIAMDTLAAAAPLRIDIVYAKPEHPENIFGEAIYRPDARLLLHREFAKVVTLAAQRCHDRHGYFFVLKDGLRPVEAQQKIIETAIVRANPHWLEEPRLFSLPGMGGHPRGMAIDVVLETEDGELLEMGTRFDHLTTNPAVNPAARDFQAIPEIAKTNRRLLEDFMVSAARDLRQPLLPLPSEWWDFRYPASYSERYAPVSDASLPAEMRLTS